MSEQHFALEGNVEHFTIADIATANPDFRKVLWTGKHSQIVLMTVPVGGEIGDEPLVLYTVYSPPEHAVDGAFATKEEADAAEAAGEDQPPQA